MTTLNKSWLMLIVFGIIFFIATLVWDFYQLSTGNDAKFTFAMTQSKSDVLISEKLEKHLTSTEDYLTYRNEVSTSVVQPTSYTTSND